MNKKGIDTNLLESKMFLNGYKTRKDFANELGVSQHTIGKILNGNSRPGFDLMNQMYVKLSLTPEEGSAIFFNNNLRNTKGEEVK